MNILLLMVKGFIIGIGKIIPGVSGAMLAISLGLYEKCLNAITSFFKNIKENVKLLLSIGLGVALAIVLGSKIIAFLLAKFYLPTILLFIGMILGGMSGFIKKLRGYEITTNKKISFLFCFMVVIILSFIKIDNQYLIYPNLKMWIYFIMGLIDAATMVIPGISGTAIFMLLGVYEISLALFASLTSIDNIIFSLPSLIPFMFGMVLGVLIVSVIMSKLLKYHEGATYYGILGFQVSAVILILLSSFKTIYTIIDLITGFLFMIIGFSIGRKME